MEFFDFDQNEIIELESVATYPRRIILYHLVAKILTQKSTKVRWIDASYQFDILLLKDRAQIWNHYQRSNFINP